MEDPTFIKELKGKQDARLEEYRTHHNDLWGKYEKLDREIRVAEAKPAANMDDEDRQEIKDMKEKRESLGLQRDLARAEFSLHDAKTEPNPDPVRIKKHEEEVEDAKKGIKALDKQQ
ncbi:hypothetical protein B0O99DRAFT_692150 [Bisporella sp. PMI_857]|nr:hypothetical protein B0O99DRAFT_692150 [Bisporella sp. PMI_857]